MLTVVTTTTIVGIPSEVTYGFGGGGAVNVIPSIPNRGIPTGNVTLYLDNTAVEVLPLLDNQESVFFSTNQFNAGTYSLRAVYSGDTNFGPSQSAAQPLTVDKADVLDKELIDPFFASFGQPTTVGAFFDGQPGTVTFYALFPSGLIDLGVGTLSDIGTGIYQIVTTALPGGSGSLYAVYSGNSNINPATTQSNFIEVSQASTATSLTVTPLLSPSGEQIAKLTSNVNSPVNSPILPTGSVTFSNGSIVLGTAPLSGGVASLNVTLPVGNDNITSTYSSDTNYLASTSPVVTQIVGSPTMRYVNQVYVDVLGRPVDIPSLLYWTGQLAKGESRQKFVSTLVLSPEGRAAEVQSQYEHYLNRLATPTQLKSSIALPFSLVALDTQIVGGEEYYLDVGELIPNYLAAIGPAVLHAPLPSSYFIQYATELDSYQPRYKVASQLLNSEVGHIARVEGYYENVLGHPADTAGLNYYVGLLNKGTAPEQVWIDLLASSEFYDSFTT